MEVEKVLETRLKKATRHKVYFEHLIKWKGKPDLEATWVAKANFKKLNIPFDLLQPENA